MESPVKRTLGDFLRERSTLELVIVLLVTSIVGGGGFSLGTLTHRLSPEEAQKQVDEAVATALAKERADQAFREVVDKVGYQGILIDENTGAINDIRAAVDTVADGINDLRRQMASGFGSLEKTIQDNHP